MTRNRYPVYHGTNLFSANLIKQYGVSLDAQRLFTDFGRGFYVTFNWKQALRWANVRANNLQISAKLLERLNIAPSDYLMHPTAKIPALLVWDLDFKELLRLKGKIFPLPSQQDWEVGRKYWEEFVLKSRQGRPHHYDFVYGPIAGGHFKHVDKIQVSRTKDQLSLNSYPAIACLDHLRIFSDVKENVRSYKSVPFLHQEIIDALVKMKGFQKGYAAEILANSWVTSLHPSILLTESPYYWAFCILKGREILWHDDFEKWSMEKGLLI